MSMTGSVLRRRDLAMTVPLLILEALGRDQMLVRRSWSVGSPSRNGGVAGSGLRLCAQRSACTLR